MKKIKLVKRSENVNYTFDAAGGHDVRTVQSAEYRIVDEKTGNDVGSASAYTGSLNVSFHGGIRSVEDAQKIIEDMVAGIVLPDDAAGIENDGEE